MEQSALVQLAKQAHVKRAEEFTYTFTWRGNAATEVLRGTAGLRWISNTLRLTYGTLANYFSRGDGQFSRAAVNPLTGEVDLLTVTRSRPDKPKPKRGRPRTKPYTEAEMAEAVQSGTTLASPARTVPKGRNRATATKP